MKTTRLALSTMKSLLALSLFCPPLSLAQRQYPPCPYAQTPTKSPVCHPYPQPMLAPSTVSTDGDTTSVSTGTTFFTEPKIDAFTVPPGTNFLPTIYTNMFDINGKEMANTLPSTPTNPYNLHEGDPVVREINPASPTDDLRAIFADVRRIASKEGKEASDEDAIRRAIQRGTDILEGNPIPDRAYSGLPLLHFRGPEKVKTVTPIHDASGRVVGGNVDIRQVWYDNHIESDTAFVDPSAVMEVPWTVTYTVSVLSRGEDDFSPFVMYLDGSQPMGMPHIGMDQSFFPMEEGTSTVFKIKMAPAKYFNLTYTWGWRMHPPRAQVFENALKKASITVGGKRLSMTLPEWESYVFKPKPGETRERLIERTIGDLSPEKQMWRAFRAAADAARARDYPRVVAIINDMQISFDDWRDRTRLPRGGPQKIEADPEADLTILYVNNTIYAEFTDRTDTIADSIQVTFPKWKLRGTTFKVTIYNGDFFEHGYQNVDFGGGRGWENQFKSSVKVGGSGCWFTFGRAFWWMNIPNAQNGDLGVYLPAANARPYKPSMHRVHITYNYEPSRRLRLYQFDPLHHDVAIFSLH